MFQRHDVIHVAGKVDPISDLKVINLELILADLQMAENISFKVEKQMKTKRDLVPTYEVLKKAIAHLNGDQNLRTLELSDEEEAILKQYSFLTQKEVIYAANVAESDLPEMSNPYVQAVRNWAAKEDSAVIPICAKFEEELAQLTPEEAKEFLESVGLSEPGLNRLVKEAFKLLGLINYITTGEVETRAWTIPKGTTAQCAASEIHSDIQKGFIRAEVVSFDDMMICGGRIGAREAGKARAEGKEYIVRDGDVILFFHN